MQAGQPGFKKSDHRTQHNNLATMVPQLPACILPVESIWIRVPHVSAPQGQRSVSKIAMGNTCLIWLHKMTNKAGPRIKMKPLPIDEAARTHLNPLQKLNPAHVVGHLLTPLRWQSCNLLMRVKMHAYTFIQSSENSRPTHFVVETPGGIYIYMCVCVCVYGTNSRKNGSTRTQQQLQMFWHPNRLAKICTGGSSSTSKASLGKGSSLTWRWKIEATGCSRRATSLTLAENHSAVAGLSHVV